MFAAGLLFALGLGVSGMTDPDKVLGFLDLSSGWDPSLALVMVGAIGVHLPLRRWVVGFGQPRFAVAFESPPTRRVTPRLVVGAALFGAGWGLGGFCPGPALVSLVSGALGSVVFVAGMTGGMLVADRWMPAVESGTEPRTG